MLYSIMAGIYPNLATAVRTISKAEGVAGFYAGWGPNLAQKIPSYGLTWVFFQQFKEAHKRYVTTIN
jgi:Mitochondrial carrier protein